VLYSPTAQTSLPLPATALTLLVFVPTLGLFPTTQEGVQVGVGVGKGAIT